MPFIPVANTIEAEMRYAMAAQRVENTLYFRPTVGNDDPSLIGLGNALLLWFNNFMDVAMPAAVQLREIHMTDLSSATAPVHTTIPPTPGLFGARPGDLSPNNVSLCTSFRTANRGRSFRGRNYLCGIVTDDVVNSTVEDPLVTDVTAAYAALLAAPFATDWEWVIVSRFTDNAPRVAGVATPVTSVVVVDRTVDSARRRLPGRGL